MTRHPSLEITDEQEANLRKLAAYLLTLPADYPDFEMDSFTADGFGASFNEAHVPACGTAACAAGHGPIAGIEPVPGETWDTYSRRAFVAYDDQWDWGFAATWSDVDNTAHGAARRIHWMLENGVPDDALEQRWGEAVLCYTEMQVSA